MIEKENNNLIIAESVRCQEPNFRVSILQHTELQIDKNAYYETPYEI